MKRLLIFLTIALATQALSAAELVVRSGEHGSFTRIVLDRPEDITWTTDSTERTLSLTFSEQVLFDTSEVFDRIGRNRISSISQDSSEKEILIELSCLCTHKISETRDLIIVDFFDSNINKNPSATRYSEGPFSLTTKEAPNLKKGPRSDEKAPENNPLQKTEIQRKIAVAASNGLLSPTDRESALPRTGDAAVNEGRQRNKNVPGIYTNEAMGFGKRKSAKVRNSKECEFQSLGGSEEGTKPAQLLESVRELRESSLFDRDPDISTIAIARLYIKHGLGVEARRHLENVQSTTQEVSALKAISYLVDGDSPSSGSALSNKTHCETELGFWSFLEGSRPLRNNAELSKQLVAHFQSLPKPLRDQIATTFLQKLRSNGMQDEAEAVAGLLKRLDAGPAAPEKHPPPDATGEFWDPTAQRAIETVVAAYDNGEGIADDLIPTLQSFSVEYRGTQLEPRLLEAEVLAFAILGQFERAFGALAELPHKPLETGLRAQIFDLITRNADDVTFAANLIPELANAPLELSADLGFQIADRLLALGFYREAEDLLGQLGDPDLLESKIIQAKIALKRGLPYRALALLYNVSGSEAETLQSEATDLIRLQNPNVFQVFPDRDDPQSTNNVNRENSQQPEANPENDLATRLDTNSLSYAQELLKSSEALRESLASGISQ